MSEPTYEYYPGKGWVASLEHHETQIQTFETRKGNVWVRLEKRKPKLGEHFWNAHTFDPCFDYAKRVCIKDDPEYFLKGMGAEWDQNFANMHGNNNNYDTIVVSWGYL